jgi:hypothetical protein
MKDHDEGGWERRPAPGSSPRSDDYAAARRSFEKSKREHERQRPRLTIAAAKRRMARYAL